MSDAEPPREFLSRADHLEDRSEALERERDEARALNSALLAENERLRDRMDEILPPLTPDFQAIMERLDAEVERLAAYENSETGKMSTPAASRSRTLEIIHTARHLVRYANDAEAGNAALRDLEALS